LLGIDNPIESYLTSGVESIEWVQIKNGKANYSITLNSDTPVVLGVMLDSDDSPVDHRVELCTRIITPKADKTDTGAEAIPAILYFLLSN
jgi:hypothetical protein